MRVHELGRDALLERLGGSGLALDFGSARARIRSTEPSLASALHRVYRHFPAQPAEGFHDVTVTLRRPLGVRRWLRPQVELIVDGRSLFAPFPADTHLPLVEWGMNHLIAERLGHRLMLHAGVVERGGRALVLPALPGSGKSTLTAALAHRGFRLLSDEFGVVDDNAWLHPMLRPVALKEASIDVIQAFAPEASWGPRFPRTRKGTVAHLAPDRASVDRRHEPARPGLVVFPRYDASATLRIEEELRSRAFGRLAVNSFNYELRGPAGFEAVAALVERSATYSLVYGDLPRAVGALHDLMDALPP
jgi:HprK-related kinase A